MPRSRINGNFIDKTSSIVANILLRIIPTTLGEKKAFTYYRDGMSAQSEGNYAEALQNYYEATRPEIDPYDRSYILYNIGLIHTSNGEHTKALEYYFRALERNPFLPQAFNNMAVICHYPIPTGENRPFYRGILKLRRLGPIKLPSIGNKL
uniref:photosystem I assembly protein Ycf3 n=1 Tax=Iris sprengeri TaxID=585821 RepID=UPI002E796E3F|nr:photosystem I assembly protein Ycf3 [Iris sprengeri]YP_011033690.1 photosystem I assembly protein Ycf3 [Iris sichuanensis]WRI14992.1 photosystem I assembly protein Ycf3 [Iris sprengeri]WRI15312.1 photosystem I assembly protein Ycf3 [Iris sichuanensis]